MFMAEILKGAPVVKALSEKMAHEVQELKAQGVSPTIAILRVGDRHDDVQYENSAIKRCNSVGVRVMTMTLPGDATQDEFDRALSMLNNDPGIHGILMFMPLPEQLDAERARMLLSPEKDIDGITDRSLSGVFTSTDKGFPSCTAQATMEMLHYYGIDIEGKKAAIIGRSLVIGRPVAMMLMHENATVTNCHTRTEDIASITSRADILVVAAGQLKLVGPEHTNPDQVIIDVGTNWDPEKEATAGDVDFERVEPVVRAISPVPGGVGRITTCVLVEHVIEAARRYAKRKPLYESASR